MVKKMWNRDIKQSLNDDLRAHYSLPVRADNTDIRVVFCGLAVTSGAQDSKHSRSKPRDSRRDDRLKLTWRSAFTAPGIVDLETILSNANEFQCAGAQRSGT